MHLTTTDPAAHVRQTLAYIAKIMASKGKNLGADGKALLPMSATGRVDPLLQARLVGEQQQTERIAAGLAQRTYALPWLPEAPVGVAALAALTQG